MKKRLIKGIALVATVFALAAVGTGCAMFREWGEDIRSVEITCAESFKVTESLELTADVTKDSAPDKSLTWEIVEGENTTAEGAKIINEKLTATSIGYVEVKATSNARPAKYDTLVIEVLKEPVVNIVNTNEKTYTYTQPKCVEKFDVSSLSATDWKGSSSKVCIINDTDGGYDTGSFRVQLGNKNDYLYKEMYFGYDDTISLEYYVRNSSSGSISSPKYMVRVSNDEGKTWLNASDELSTSGTNWKKRELTIKGDLIPEGGERNIWLAFYTSYVYAIGYIDDISYTVSSKIPTFNAGESLTLTGKVYPENATFQDITYEIVKADETTGASLDGNVLSATGAGIVQIRPKADGVSGHDIYVRVA